MTTKDQIYKDAVVIAKGAGNILRDAFGNTRTIKYKGSIDLITDADRASEKYILTEIHKRYKEHAIFAEESGDNQKDGPWRWVIDPLDGTTNFAHGVPYYAVLITVQERIAPNKYASSIAITYDPSRDELFVANKNTGATLNGKPISVSDVGRLIESLPATGFAYDRIDNPDDNHAEFCRLNLLTQGVRRCGSAGLDLAYVACGRFDAFWEYRLNLWDIAGGILLVSEAGGKISTLQGNPLQSESLDIVVSNGYIHEELLQALRKSRQLPIGSRENLT
ncbi:MAG: inositol monophosphatase [Deltaproteobacteria bacterium]|nr:inositol monophosphatase [Deltaproteobacteria bacterium]